MSNAQPCLDLTKTHKQRLLGDIAVWFTWYGETARTSEPCMVLTSANRTGVGRGKPCVVPLSNAWLYNEPSYLLRTARIFADALGMTDDMMNVHKVADIIRGHLDDLVLMPERPDSDRVVVADAQLIDNSGRTHSFELLDHK